MIVMGAYSHIRLSQSILGGLTDSVLRNADIPMLMSH
jgi:nucleotide-binding universal stress UspA family protein